jgi:transcriptional antiterminator RfaH
MSHDGESINGAESRAWYCIRTQTKREHIAATILNQIENIEVFSPRISQVKKTRTGKKRFIEALFPGYFFAKFEYAAQFRIVMHSQGVSRIVELGDRKIVPEHIIADLKASLPQGIIEAPDPSIEPGANIEFVAGSLKGLNGKVLAQLPASDRIKVLLTFLGQEVTVNVPASEIHLHEG